MARQQESQPPSLLDRYMATARHVSRLAIGSASIQPTAETFRLRADLSQDIVREKENVVTLAPSKIAF